LAGRDNGVAVGWPANFIDSWNWMSFSLKGCLPAAREHLGI
jgi:hypothetical protein